MITSEVIQKFDAILARGLCSGVGSRDGQMCIEAAVCAALGLPHGDDPKCVAKSVRRFKISLNDSNWSSPQARAKNLRDLGIAQIGSLGVIDDVEFSKRLAEKTIRFLVPKLFRQVFPDNQACLDAALRCEQEGTAAAAAAAAAEAAAEAARVVRAADVAGEARAAAARAAAARAAAARARAAEAAAWAARAAAAAEAAAEAAAWAARAAEAAGVAATDKFLILSAQLALEVLKELNSPGCEWIK